ncbi:MAG: hypothetical protein PGN13_16120 [Patulibacter minatonensis]
MSNFLKSSKVVATAVGLLERELVLPRLVWRDAAFDPTLSQGDTVSLKLPAYAPARTRALRSGAPRTKDALHERKVDVSLDVDVYKDVPITDEQLSLDIANFGEQVLNPVVGGIAQRLEQELYDTIGGATYTTVLTHDLSADKAYNTVVDARLALNDANIPQQGRSLVVGSDFEAALLKSDQFVHVALSGTDSVLREAQIGRIAGFDVFSAPGLAPDQAYAFHKTAYAMAQRAPLVPAGAPWGAVTTYQGLSIRTVRVFDPDLVEDRFIADAWCGFTPVTDDGYFDGNGKFVPTTEPGVTLGDALALTSGEADDETIVASKAHGFSAGDKVQFSALTGGAGLSPNTDYYVIGAGLSSTNFRVSATSGGSAVNFTTDITAGAVKKHAAPMFVRALKIVVVP